EDDRVDESDERRLRDAVLDLEVAGLLLFRLEQRLLLRDRRACTEGLGGAREAAELREDVLAGGDGELELVAACEPQLVDRVQVGGVGDRDPKGVGVERKGDGNG